METLRRIFKRKHSVHWLCAVWVFRYERRFHGRTVWCLCVLWGRTFVSFLDVWGSYRKNGSGRDLDAGSGLSCHVVFLWVSDVSGRTLLSGVYSEPFLYVTPAAIQFSGRRDLWNLWRPDFWENHLCHWQ